MSKDTEEYSIQKLIDLSEFEIEKPQFAQLYNFVLQNLIEPSSLTIWCYLQSKPSNWRPRKKEIENHFPTIGRDKTHKAFMILKECGLYEAFPVKQNGKVTDWKIKINCGVGCEEKILIWKEKFISEHIKNKQKKTKNHTTENQYSGENHTTENQECGENTTTLTGRGPFHNTDLPDSGKSVHIQKKENSLQKKDFTTTTKTKNPVVVVISKSIDQNLRTAYRLNPVHHPNIHCEDDFMEYCQWAIDVDRPKNASKIGRAKSWIKFIEQGNFEISIQWTKKFTKTRTIESISCTEITPEQYERNKGRITDLMKSLKK